MQASKEVGDRQKLLSQELLILQQEAAAKGQLVAKVGPPPHHVTQPPPSCPRLAPTLSPPDPPIIDTCRSSAPLSCPKAG